MWWLPVFGQGCRGPHRRRENTNSDVAGGHFLHELELALLLAPIKDVSPVATRRRWTDPSGTWTVRYWCDSRTMGTWYKKQLFWFYPVIKRNIVSTGTCDLIQARPILVDRIFLFIRNCDVFLLANRHTSITNNLVALRLCTTINVS